MTGIVTFVYGMLLVCACISILLVCAYYVGSMYTQYRWYSVLYSRVHTPVVEDVPTTPPHTVCTAWWHEKDEKTATPAIFSASRTYTSTTTYDIHSSSSTDNTSTTTTYIDHLFDLSDVPMPIRRNAVV